MSTAPENLESEHWWRRPGGPGEVLALAIPLIVSTMSFSIMHFIDRMFLMWDSNEAMAAALPAGMVNWTVVSLPMGIAAYANTFVAQYYGANRKDRIGAVIWQAIWIGIAAMPFFFVLSRFSPQLFTAFGHSPSMVALESSYLKVLCLAACAVPLNAATCSYYVGRGKNSVVMWVNIISAIMNIVLDYWWIFGGLGVPAGGVEGAAYATACSCSPR